MERFDIAVIGGGASGLAAAIRAYSDKTDGVNVAVLERLPRVGKKLLATGNGRCNFTNRGITASRYYGSCKELYALCGRYPADGFLRELGVMSFADEAGRVYPRSNTAASVLDALRLKCDVLGVRTICDFEVTEIEAGKPFIIRSSNDAVTADRVIIAGGGRSQSALGSNGSMLGICKGLGLRVSPQFSALTSVKTDINLVRPLKGQRVTAKVSAVIDGKVIASETGEVQFGDGVISGICVFDLTCRREVEKADICLDLLPDMSADDAYDMLRDIRESRSDAALEDYLSGVFNKRIGMYMIKQCVDKPLTDRTGGLTDKEVRSIAEKAKRLIFPARGVSGFEKSQVTGGGVVMDEIDENLQSRKISGLYLCGEILDIHGECGGYNLAFAFASGMHAGTRCRESVTGRSDDKS